MTELPIQALLLEVIEVVSRLKIPYVIMGGFAVRMWGVPRPTYDADLAISVDGAGLGALLAALEESGFDVPEEHVRGSLEVVAGLQKLKVARFVERSVWEVDLFLARSSLLESALHRARTRTLQGHPVQVMSPEDVILLKLLAHRRKDQLDIEEILKITPDIDAAHLRAWAAKLGVGDRLQSFLNESG